MKAGFFLMGISKEQGRMQANLVFIKVRGKIRTHQVFLKLLIQASMTSDKKLILADLMGEQIRPKDPLKYIGIKKALAFASFYFEGLTLIYFF